MNAYEVLGVEEGASAAEINQAYKQKILLYSDRTDDEAIKKAEEINAAYDSLMYSGQTTFNSSSEPSIKYGDVRAKINENRYEDAQTILDGVPIDMRDGEWYFLKGKCFHKMGWLEDAANHYKKAVGFEPNNSEYVSALNDIENKRKGTFRQKNSAESSTDGCCSCGACDLCATLACCDCLCSCLR